MQQPVKPCWVSNVQGTVFIWCQLWSLKEDEVSAIYLISKHFLFWQAFSFELSSLIIIVKSQSLLYSYFSLERIFQNRGKECPFVLVRVDHLQHLYSSFLSFLIFCFYYCCILNNFTLTSVYSFSKLYFLKGLIEGLNCLRLVCFTFPYCSLFKKPLMALIIIIQILCCVPCKILGLSFKIFFLL